jgi:hypothetical protein
MMTRSINPVMRFFSSCMVIPSMTSCSFTVPSYSETIGKRVGIPLSHDFADSDFIAFRHADTRAVRECRGVLFPPRRLRERQNTVSRHGNQNAFAVFDGAEVQELDRSAFFGVDLGFLNHAAGRSADMEGAERQLGAGFADGLSGDHTHRFAHFHPPAVGQIQSVTFRADAKVASQVSTDRMRIRSMPAAATFLAWAAVIISPASQAGRRWWGPPRCPR